MRTLLLIFSLFSVVTFSCSSDDEDPNGNGCLTGVSKQSGQRVLIRCCTRKEYLAGDNVSAGGTSSWNGYTSHKWEFCDDCK